MLMSRLPEPRALKSCVLGIALLIVSVGFAQPGGGAGIRAKVQKLHSLLLTRQQQGIDVSQAEAIDRQSRAAAQRGDHAEAQRLLDEAISTLERLPSKAAPEMTPAERPAKPPKPNERRGPPNRQRQGGPREYTGDRPVKTGSATGNEPVFVVPFTHHYNGPGGYYAPAKEVRETAAFFHEQQIPGTLFFDGILVGRLKKEDPGIFAQINEWKLPLGYHGEETHGPYPVGSDLCAEVYHLQAAQGYKGKWSITTGLDWTTGIQKVIERYSHPITHSVDESRRMLQRQQETLENLPGVGGLKLVQEAFGRDVSMIPSHGLESATVGMAFRRMSSFMLDQPAVPIALHALKIFKIGEVADQVMAIAGENTSIFWYMGRIMCKGDQNGESSWRTGKLREAVQSLDRNAPRLLLMGFSSFDPAEAAQTVRFLNEDFFPAHPGSGWVSGENLHEVLEAEKKYSPAKSDLEAMAATLANSWQGRPPDLVTLPHRVFSLCDSFEALAKALAGRSDEKGLPESVEVLPLLGPVIEDDRASLPGKTQLSVADVTKAATEVVAGFGKGNAERFVPGKVRVGAQVLNCAEFLIAMAKSVQVLSTVDNKGGIEAKAVEVDPARVFPPYADLLVKVFKPRAVQPLCYTNGQLWTVKPVRAKRSQSTMDPDSHRAPKRPAGNGPVGALQPPLSTQVEELELVFASNLDGQGGCYREDVRGADLFRCVFNMKTRTASQLKRLTAEPGVAEWFPSLSPDGRMVAYNRMNTEQRGPGQNRVVIASTDSGKELCSLDDSRFPCFSADGTRLAFSSNDRRAKRLCVAPVTVQSGNVVLGSPVVAADEQQGSDRVEDPSFFPDGRRIAFHRKETQGGAGAAVIGIDGTGFAAVSGMNGAGHVAVNPDGRTIIWSRSQTGSLEIVQEIAGGWSSPLALPVPTESAVFAAFDSRLGLAGTVAHTYLSWVAPDLLLVSSQGSEGGKRFTCSRLFLLKFASWEQPPEIIDVSGAIEKLAGKTGRDFCTGDGRNIR